MKEQTKKDIRNILIILALVFFDVLIYMTSKQFPNEPLILNNEIEDKIPLVPVFIIPYILWWVLIIIVPFYISRKSDKAFMIYVFTFAICFALTFPFYVFFPTAVKIPVFESTDFFSWLCNFVYSVDIPLGAEHSQYYLPNNCLPSGHTLASMIIIYTTSTCKKINKGLKIFIDITMVIVIISTILVKQHVVVDLIAAIIISTLVFFVVRYFVNKYYGRRRNI